MTTYAASPPAPSPPHLAFTRGYGSGGETILAPPPRLTFTRGYASFIGTTNPAPLVLTFARNYGAGATLSAPPVRPVTGLLYPVRRRR